MNLQQKITPAILNLEVWEILVAVAPLNMVSIKLHIHSSSTLTNEVLTLSPFLLCAYLTSVACAQVASNPTVVTTTLLQSLNVAQILTNVKATKQIAT